jgi:ketosteroid isomerase-like protein
MSNKDVVAALYAAFAKRDLAAVAALSDSELVIDQTELLPWGGTYRGLAGLKEFTAKLLGHVDSQVTAEEYVESGERVAVIGRTKGTVRSSGAPFDVRVVHVWTVRDGKAIRFEPNIDTPGMLKVLAAGG